MDLNERYQQVELDINKIETEMKQLKVTIEQLKRETGCYDELKMDLKDLKLNHTNLTTKLEKKKESLNAIENSKIKNLIFAFSGGKAEKLKKLNEEITPLNEEVLQLTLKIEKTEKEIHDINRTFNTLNYSLQKLRELGEKRKQLYHDRLEISEILNQSNIDEFLDTTETEKQLRILKYKVERVESAYHLGKEILNTMASLTDDLSDALTGVLFIKGRVSLIQQKQHLHIAKGKAEKLELLSKRFTNQLEDLKYDYTNFFEFSIPKITFVEALLTNNMIDSVDQKIKEMLTEVKKEATKVEKFNHLLEMDLANLKEKLNELEQHVNLQIKYK